MECPHCEGANPPGKRFWGACGAAFGSAPAIRPRRPSWPRSAATSFARLWLDQGRQAEAHDLLAPTHGWFTEGFDTPDLRQAGAF